MIVKTPVVFLAAAFLTATFLTAMSLAIAFSATFAYAVTCNDLNSTAKTRDFLSKSRDANPLSRSNLSVYLEVSPCDGKECLRKNRKTRIALLQRIHLVRTGNRRRALMMRGPNAPQCMISRDKRDYLCSRCDITVNASCRNIVRESASGRILGTNIDVSDFDVYADKDFESTCTVYPKDSSFIQLDSRRVRGSHRYERIVSLFDAKREVPVTVNYFSKGVLRKVYRFFPKYYVKLGSQWMATIVRVRSTQGSEKKYAFETQVRILPGKSGKPRIYLNPTKDPSLMGQDMNALFLPN